MIVQIVIGAGRGLSSAGAAALRPAVGMIELTLRAERSVRWDASRRLAEAVLLVEDALLRSPWADEVVQHALDSGLVERALARALSGNLVDQIARDLLRHEAVERATAEILAGDTLERIVASEALRDAASRALESESAEQLLAGALASPGAERLLSFALDSPDTERLVARVVESRVLDQAIARLADEAAELLPRSPAFWSLIDEVAGSPAVTDAISQQGASFADQVAEDVRERSRTFDARLERAAWRLLRRRAPVPGGAT